MAWYNLGDTLLALGRYEEACRCLARCLELGGTSWLVRYDLGLALYHLGRFEEAAYVVRDIIGSDVDVRRAYTSPLISTATNLALCYGELGRWKEALSALRPAVTEASTAPFNIARLHLRSGKPRDAARYFVMAAELKTESEEALHGVGVAFMELRDWRNAEHYLHLTTRAQPRCADAWYDLGVTYAKQRKPKLRTNARRCFERALTNQATTSLGAL